MTLAGLAQADARRISATSSPAIHALRVRMKKLRALLKLAGKRGEKQTTAAVVECIREVKDTLAAPRDAEVLHRVAKRFSGGGRMARPRRAPNVTPLVKKLHSLLGAMDLSGLTWQDVARAHAGCYRRCRRAMRCASEFGGDGDFHRWRRRVKDFYYQGLAMHRFTTLAPLRPLQELGQLLGRVQDLVMLENHFIREQARRKVRRALVCKRLRMQKEALRKGAGLFRQRASKFRKRAAESLSSGLSMNAIRKPGTLPHTR